MMAPGSSLFKASMPFRPAHFVLTSNPMKTTITKTTDTDATFTVALDHTHLEPLKVITIDKLRGRVKVAGFRPGKAPDHIVARELGDAAIQSEVIDAAISASYSNAVSEHQLSVIAPPEVSITKFVPFTELEYTATVDIMPEIKLADYKNIKKKKPEVKVEPAEVDQTIEDLRKRMATKTNVERAASLGDEVVFDFDGTKDGQPVEGASAKNHTLVLGSQTFIPGFEEELVGLKPGDAKTFKITFPADYQAAELAGQEVTFTVTVHKVGELVLPEPNAEFVASISQFKTLDELKADISERIKTEKTDQLMAAFEQDILDEIVAKSKWSASKRLVDAQLERIKGELSERLASSGLDMDKYLSLSDKTLEDMENEMRPNAEKRVGLALVLNRIAKEEGIGVTHEEIDAELAQLKATYQDPEMQSELDGPRIHEEIQNHLLASKTVAKILSYITG